MLEATKRLTGIDLQTSYKKDGFSDFGVYYLGYFFHVFKKWDIKNIPSPQALREGKFGILRLAVGWLEKGLEIWKRYMGVSKNRGNTPKMDVENNGKTLFFNGWFGGTIIFGNTHIP